MIARLSPRERLLVFGALPVIALVAAWQFLWLPLQDARAQARTEIAAYRQVQLAAARAGDLPAVAETPAPSTPLSSRVTQSAEAAGLTLRRIETDGAGLRVTLEDGDFTRLVLWLAELEEVHRVVAREVEIDRRPEPGIVSARLMLEDL